METLEQKIARVVKEKVAIAFDDPHWPEMFEAERVHLLTCPAAGLIRRIEHFGSTPKIASLTPKPKPDSSPG